MRGHWRYFGGALVIALGVAAGPLEAQRGFGGRGRGFQDPAGPNLGSSAAVAIEHQEELALSGEQVAQLQEMKILMDGEIAGLTEEMNTLQEGIRAGDLDRADGFRQMDALRGELITASAPLRGRVQEILTVDQHNRLQPMVWEGRPGAGRGGAARGGLGVTVSPRGGGAFQGQGRGAGVQGNPRGGRGGVAARPMARGQAHAPVAMRQGRGVRSGRGLRSPAYFRRGIGGDLPENSVEDWNLR
jgi:hypothetical protein